VSFEAWFLIAWGGFLSYVVLMAPFLLIVESRCSPRAIEVLKRIYGAPLFALLMVCVAIMGLMALVGAVVLATIWLAATIIDRFVKGLR
jgi:hypothetical protein